MKRRLKILSALAVLVLTIMAFASCTVTVGRSDFESSRERLARERDELSFTVKTCDCSAEMMLGAPATAENSALEVCSLCGLPYSSHVQTLAPDGDSAEASSEEENAQEPIDNEADNTENVTEPEQGENALQQEQAENAAQEEQAENAE